MCWTWRSAARGAPDELEDVDYDATLLVGIEALGLDMGVDETELTCPVPANRLVAVLTPAFHRIRPVDVVMHERQCRLDVAPIERVVRATKELLELPHSAFSTRSAEPAASTETASVSRAIQSAKVSKSASASGTVRSIRSVSSSPASLRMVLTVWMRS